jgi:hypothetical protein
VPIAGTGVTPGGAPQPPPAAPGPDTPSAGTPDVTPAVVTPAVVTPAVVTPVAPPAAPLAAQGPVLVRRSQAALRVTRLVPSGDGRRLTIRGRVARGARGPVAITVTGRVGRKTYTIASAGRLRGATTYTFTVAMTKAMKKWSRLQALVRFGGSPTVQPGAALLVLVRAR